MRKCPFCAEEIQPEAIKCKHCGSMLDGSQAPGLSRSVQPAALPPAVQVKVVKPPDGLMTQVIKLAGFIISLGFLVGLGTCAYTCVVASKAVSDADQKRRTIATSPPTDEGRERRARAASVFAAGLTQRGIDVDTDGDLNTTLIFTMRGCTREKMRALATQEIIEAGFTAARCVSDGATVMLVTR